MTSAATPLLRATIIAFTFFILELIAGWMSGSLAIVSDALSLFQSSVGFAVGWAAIHMAEWGPTRRHTFGFARVELLGSMITVILNWLLAIGLLLQASMSLQYPTLSNPHIMLPISLISLFRNLTTLLLLIPPSPMPTTEQTPLLQHSRPIQPPNLNLKTAFISSLSDTICSALLLLASCLLLQHPDSTKIDPAFTIAIAIVNIVSSFPLLNQYLSIILEGVPSHLCAEEIRSDLLETFPFINAIHSVNVWTPRNLYIEYFSWSVVFASQTSY
ncbi:cation efflux protein [Rhizoclosmatium globosum]|uniref:Cation efflux protein n=1 Tax=Rhizoclosmatium globosum TaxID=329046 RepID=A0A1Y2B7Y0_9FUNG|nr:cation efflux protein [Rhizoclosmatium globosum]|eukprot:ORY30932.1 cation efflux protein [Rhizoclosmatium globosum]